MNHHLRWCGRQRQVVPEPPVTKIFMKASREPAASGPVQRCDCWQQPMPRGGTASYRERCYARRAGQGRGRAGPGLAPL